MSEEAVIREALERFGLPKQSYRVDSLTLAPVPDSYTIVYHPKVTAALAALDVLVAERDRLRGLLAEAREELRVGVVADWHHGHVARGEASAEDCLVCDIDAVLASPAASQEGEGDE